MGNRRVVITAIGVYSNNGNNTEEFWESCVEGKSGFKACTLFDVSKLRTGQVGQITEDIPYMVDDPKELGRIQYIIKKSVDEMFEDSGISKEEIEKLDERASISIATSLAANNNIIKYAYGKEDGDENPEWLTTIPSFTNWFKQYCNIGGGCYTTMAACASGTTAIGIAFDMIKNDKVDMVIAGGADQMTEFSCVGFHALKSLSNYKCKPFDKKRDGINIGEAGAFFLVEELQHALDRNAKIYGEILGYGINNDAYHITSPSPDGEGAKASMKMALKDTGVELSQIDYINAHGTGTELNDSMESKAINDLFDHAVTVSSTKATIGHCMAASGALEFAAVLLAIKYGQVPPTLGLTDKMDECEKMDYNTELRDKNVEYAMSNSFAFAGNSASILVGAYKDE